MARNLVQALEGINFPCGRSRVLEYAQRNDISPRALESLESLPDIQFQNMSELFTALPSKSQQRKLRVIGHSSETSEVRDDAPEEEARKKGTPAAAESAPARQTEPEREEQPATTGVWPQFLQPEGMPTLPTFSALGPLLQWQRQWLEMSMHLLDESCRMWTRLLSPPPWK